MHSAPRDPACAADPEAPGALGLLLGINLRQGWRRLRALRHQSRLLNAVIATFLVGYLWLAFVLFAKGFRFVEMFPGLGSVLAERLLFLLFAFLFGLLLFSNLIISYTNLFRNREAQFLLTLPVSARTIFQWKFLESTVLASWAFLFLVAPLLAAYGLTHRVAWHFYPVTAVFLGLFIVLPAVAGSWAAVHLARHLDRRAFQIAAILGALALLAASAWWLKPEPLTEEQLETRVLVVLDRLLAKTRFAQFPLLPSYWLSAGVQQWSEGAHAGAGFFLLVLLSYVLFFGWFSFTRMGGRFFEAVSAVQSRGSVLARWGWYQAWDARRQRVDFAPGWLDRLARRLRFLPCDVRALVVKDVRVFWRDTTQWGQSLVLFGLLGVYLLNLRHFSQQLTNPFWSHLVSYLNLGACALNLATLTTRFVFPQFSLEGKRTWIVGLAPLGLPRVLFAKFGLASAGSLAITLALILVSCRMLEMPGGKTLYFAAAVTVMTFTLNGLAVGLGALYPNFREDNPSKIVSGFGGTFCLVLSFLYVLGGVGLLAAGSPWAAYALERPEWMGLSWLGFAVLSCLAGWVPLRLGLQRVAAFEL